MTGAQIHPLFERQRAKRDMSDRNITESDLQFKFNIEVTSLKYAAQQSTRNVLFCVDIPYPVFKMWHNIIENKTSEAWGKRSYTDLLEMGIPAEAFTFLDSPNIRKETHNSLTKICGSVVTICRKVCCLNTFNSVSYLVSGRNF